MKSKLALLLAVIMLVGIFGACTNEPAPVESPSEPTVSASTPSEPQPAPPASPDAPPAPPEDEEPEPEPEPESSMITGYAELGTPIVDYKYDLPLFPGEKVSYSVWVSMSEGLSAVMPNGFYDNVGYQKSVELTGVELEFIFAASQTNTEKFNLMISTGDYTNIITNVGMLWSQSYDYAIEEEIFYDLTEMVENYMPVYKTLYDTLDDNVKRDLHTDGGNFPRLISLNYDFQDRSEGPMIRRDYLKKVNMDMPYTYDEWDAVLRAFKVELDIPQPLMLPKGIVHTANSLVSGYDVLGTFSTFPMISEPYYQVDGKIKYGIVEPGYKEYMEMIAGWYKDGLISSEFIVLNDNPMGSVYTAEITSGNAGIFFADGAMFANYIDSGTATNPDFDIWALPEPVKEEGQITHFLSIKSPIEGRLSNICVSTSVNSLEKLGTYLDWFFTPEGAMLAAAGIEGRSWEYDADGTIVRPDEWNNSPLTEQERGQFYYFGTLPMLAPEGLPQRTQSEAQIAASPIWESNSDSAYMMPTTLSISTEDQEYYTKIYNDIQTYVEENLAKFATCEKDMSEWGTFIDHIMGMGLEDCIAVKQDALDRYYNR